MTWATNEASELTAREQEVLYCVAQGMSNCQIARFLGVSNETVKSHLAHMFEKARSTNRAALVTYGFETGVLRVG